MIIYGIKIEKYYDYRETIYDYLAMNKLTVNKGDYNKRLAIVLIMSIQLLVIKLKNSTNETIGVDDDYQQLETNKMRIYKLFNHNAVLVINEGINTKTGSLTTDFVHFMTLSTKMVEQKKKSTIRCLDTLINGMFNKENLLDLTHYL